MLREVPSPLNQEAAIIRAALRSAIAKNAKHRRSPYESAHYGEEDFTYSFVDEFSDVEELTGDRELMLEACRASPDVFELMNEELRNDREIAETVLAKQG